MRDMSPREEEYAAKGVQILAINALEDPAAGRAWIEKSELDLHWVFADAAAIEAFDVSMVPTQVIIDRNGNVAWTSSLKSLTGGADAIFEALDEVL